MPDWITECCYVESTKDTDALIYVLEQCLNGRGTVMPQELLSQWMGVEVKQVGEEEYRGGVQFT